MNNGVDTMTQQIEDNYYRVKQEVKDIVKEELVRIGKEPKQVFSVNILSKWSQ